MISVVITCYNYGKFLPECIESVINQSFKDIEIIVINDGSTDNTYNSIQPYLSNLKIKYIEQKNSGQANAKNNGIKNSNGEFVAFLDADDLWEKTKLEKQLAIFNDPRVGVVFSKANFIDEDSNIIDFQFTSKTMKPVSGDITTELFLDNFIPFSSTMVRKECLDKFGLFDESIRMGIDWDLWLRISTEYHFEYVNEYLLLYRIGHAGQMSKNLEVRQKDNDIILNRFLKNYPNIIPKSIIKKGLYITNCNRGYYYSDKNMRISLKHYFMALKYNMFDTCAYKGIVKSL